MWPKRLGLWASVVLVLLRGHVVWAHEPEVLPFDVQAEPVFQELTPSFCWFHPRVAPLPGFGKDGRPAVVMTVQKHLSADDHYSGLYFLRTDDLGQTWTGPTEIPELVWQPSEDNEVIAVCDVTPGWHAPSGKLLAIGIKLRYSQHGAQLLDKPRSNECAYATFDPKTRQWTRWKMLAMPQTDSKFFLVAPGCVQWLVRDDGTLLIPTYFKGPTGSDYTATVLHCSFDGSELRYLSHGTELTTPGGRGFVEPSLARFGGTYYLTLRNDAAAYVTTSPDGLNFQPVKKWTFDDDQELGSYNTQAHWLVHSDGLFLTYTRRGANNDHIARNRAPLFVAQIDPETLQVIRRTERVLLPERGVMLGNFGAAAITPDESWVTDAEYILTGTPHPKGADGTTWLGRVRWSKPNQLANQVHVGLRKQLFVDDYIVAEKQGVTRELGLANKTNGGQPIFTDGWFYGTVLHDDGKFKLWYRKPETKGYGYAESTDGLAFQKVADLQGIYFAGDYTLAVEIDAADDDPQHRFKAGYDAPGMAAGIAHSPDGIRWTPYNDGQPVTHRAADTYNQILWDPEAMTYRLFTRTDFGTAGGATELRGTRSMINPTPKLNPTNWLPTRDWILDREGKEEAHRRQIYAATCWIYHGVYFALLSVYEFPGDVSEGQTTDLHKHHERDVMNFYIATSRDGDTWDLHWVYAGQPLIPRGPDGAFDKDLLLPASTVVTYADKHWLYYAGANERHGNEQVRFDRQHAIGLATLRLDGFVSLTAGGAEGTIVTKPFKLDGDKLMVNVDACGGEASVEVLDEQGQPVPGFSGEEVVALTDQDELRWQPPWKQHADLSALRDKIVRLKFHLRDTKFYSFQIGRNDD